MFFPNDLSVHENIFQCLRAKSLNDMRLIPFEFTVSKELTDETKWAVFNAKSGMYFIYNNEVMHKSLTDSTVNSHYVLGMDHESYGAIGNNYYRSNDKISFRSYHINNVDISKSTNDERDLTTMYAKNGTKFVSTVMFDDDSKELALHGNHQHGSFSFVENYDDMGVLQKSSVIIRDYAPTSNLFHIDLYKETDSTVLIEVYNGFVKVSTHTLELGAPELSAIYNPYNMFQIECTDDIIVLNKIKQAILDNTARHISQHGNSYHLSTVLHNFKTQMEAKDEYFI